MASIIKESELYVTDLLANSLDNNYLYHNLRHTQRVVESVKELIDNHDLKKEDIEHLTLAAWFHDVGYISGHENHEEKSCSIAKEFLEKKKYDEAGIQHVCQLIMATKRQYQPEQLLEKIIKDADASHLCSSSYLQTSDLLREELERLGIAEFSIKAWRNENINMFRTEHRYYTDYAIQNWQEGKDKNLKKLVKNSKKEKKLIKKERLKAELKTKFKDGSPERGIQTMFRVTMRNHLKLSDIADTKANILLSVNAIIISMVLANLIPKLDNPHNAYLIYPSAIFVLFSIASMIMSVLATRPNVTGGEFTKEDVKQKRVNLLFFGNFHKMKLPEYEWAIMELIKDQKYVYSSLTKDLYFLGIVLDRKYKLLRWTYTIFMIGMILSVIAFFVALKFYGPERIIELPTPNP